MLGGVLTLAFFFLRPQMPSYQGAAAPILEVIASNPSTFELHNWGISVGFLFMLFGFVGFREQLRTEEVADAWSRLGLIMAILMTGLVLIETVIDGTVFVEVAQRWSAASGVQRTMLGFVAYHALVLNVAILGRGLLLFALTVGLFGLAMLSSEDYPHWLGVLGLLIGGLGVLAGGAIIVQGVPSFTVQLAVLPVVVVGLIWVSLTGWFSWRL